MTEKMQKAVPLQWTACEVDMDLSIISYHRKGQGTMERGVFSSRLAELRKRKGVSRYVLSELCGLGHDAIRRYENGEAEPVMGSLCRIADYFGVSLDWLCGRE